MGKTGQTADVGKDQRLYIGINPPIYSKMVRVVMDFNPMHYEKPPRLVQTVKGKFDFQVELE